MIVVCSVLSSGVGEMSKGVKKVGKTEKMKNENKKKVSQLISDEFNVSISLALSVFVLTNEF